MWIKRKRCESRLTPFAAGWRAGAPREFVHFPGEIRQVRYLRVGFFELRHRPGGSPPHGAAPAHDLARRNAGLGANDRPALDPDFVADAHPSADHHIVADLDAP